LKTLKTFLPLIFLLFGKSAFSQPDSILSLPAGKQVSALWKQYYPDLVKKDSQQVMQELKKLEDLFEHKGNLLLRRQVWLMQHLYLAQKERYNPLHGASVMLNAAEMAHEKDWDLIEAECWHNAGGFYFNAGKSVLAFEYMLKAQNVFDEYGKDEYPYLVKYADAIAGCYYHFGEFREAVRYLHKIIPLSEDPNALIYFPSVYNTLGLCYQQLKIYDSAAIWFGKSYDRAAFYKDTFYMGLANGNLGFTWYLQGQYDKALPLLQADHAASTRAGELGSAANAAVLLADICIKKGQLPVAENYLDLTREFVYKSGSVSLRKSWYEDLFYLYKAKKEYGKMELYADSLLAYKDSVAVMLDKKAFNQTVLKLESEKYMNEVNQLESRRKQQIMLRNSLLIGLVLLAIIAMLWVNRQLLKHNKEKELARQQLVFAEQELTTFTEQLKEKNTLLERLRDEMEQANDSQERTGTINSLLESTILTEEEWKKFRQLFEKVYPGFFIRLKDKIPDLSPTETRLLALTKLQLSPKDMASMLGVSYDAIRKAKQRLRKKINLPEEGGLEELVELV
jgi:tetratricopeptide (TPR) repeat protein